MGIRTTYLIAYNKIKHNKAKIRFTARYFFRFSMNVLEYQASPSIAASSMVIFQRSILACSNDIIWSNHLEIFRFRMTRSLDSLYCSIPINGNWIDQGKMRFISTYWPAYSSNRSIKNRWVPITQVKTLQPIL